MAEGYTNSTYWRDSREFLEIKKDDNGDYGAIGYWYKNSTPNPNITSGDADKDLSYSGYLYANKVYGAVWNDYAETRLCQEEDINRIEPGDLVCEIGDDLVGICHKYGDPTAMIVSDTYGFCVGERGRCYLPIALCGRVLVKPKYSRDKYRIGDPVCADDGGIVVMDRSLIALYPDALIGTVVSIPKYEVWNGVSVNGRIWVKVR